MSEVRTAIAELMLGSIRTEDTTGVEKTVNSNADVVMWRSVLRHEFRNAELMDGVLQTDIVIPKLVMCEIMTISAFHYAALRGADVILTMFIDKLKMPVDICLTNGSTALHFACFAGMLGTVKMLLDTHKADLSKTDNYGWSPLHYASISGQLPVVEYLVSRKVDITLRDKDGTTAAYRAKLFDHTPVVSFFTKVSGDDDLLLVADRADDTPKQSDQTEPLYTDIKTAKAARAAGNDPNLSEEEYAARKLIQENDYELPDKLVTRIQCKYIPSTPGETELDESGKVQGSKQQLPESEYMTGENVTVIDEQLAGAKREKSRAKIRKIVEHQLNEILVDDTYLNPRQSEDPVDDQNNTLGIGIGGGIGYNTLTQVIRDELKKFKAASLREQQAAMEDDDGIYEDISKMTLSGKADKNRWVVGGRTLRGMRNATLRDAPPLPPRNSLKITDESMFIKADAALSAAEFSKAGLVLDRIEETTAVMDACFRDLVSKLNQGDWQKVAQALPLREQQAGLTERIKHFEKLYPGDQKKQALEALNDWRVYVGKKADVGALIGALKKSKIGDKIVSSVQTVAQEFSAA